MNISFPYTNTINFGKKFPITQAQVLNTQNDSFEKATIYKYDCRDESDINAFKNLSDNWIFKDKFVKNITEKVHSNGRYGSQTTADFFVMENPDGEIIGACEIEEYDDNIYDIKYIETSPDTSNKYVGQVMLASVCEEILNKGAQKLIVSDYLDTALPFYTDVCGFEEDDECFLIMDEDRINQFIEETEDKTESYLKDLRISV